MVPGLAEIPPRRAAGEGGLRQGGGSAGVVEGGVCEPLLVGQVEVGGGGVGLQVSGGGGGGRDGDLPPQVRGDHSRGRSRGPQRVIVGLVALRGEGRGG